MIRLTNQNGVEQRDVLKLMKDMIPLEVCVVVSGYHAGSLVMRTASTCAIEIMDLTQARESSCWTGSSDIKVRELYPGEKYLLELS
jgi:hypothetical protein